MSGANSGSSTSNGNGASGSAFGRMFRRYSQTNKTDTQRSSSTIRDRDTFTNMTRNTSSPSLARESSSGLLPARSSTAGSSHPFPRSTSTSSNLLERPSEDGPAESPALPSLPDVIEPQSTPSQAEPQLEAAPVSPAVEAEASSPASRPMNNIHRIRLVPHLEATRSLHFEPIERDMKEGAPAVKVGRFTDRQPSQQPEASTLAGAPIDGVISAFDLLPVRGQPGARGGAIPFSGGSGGGGRIDSSRIAFKSKVVSRGHSEVWCEPGGKFFIRDTKSSSGTFLNHIRLSAPNAESRPFAIKDGDVIQLGVDYQGGTEEIYRCVKMRVELNRGWQREANQFNINALRQLRALQGSSLTPDDTTSTALPTNRQGVSVTDCCICLFSVTVCQALFIAPCSHVFHYKCIRPLLNLHHPGFSCPLCRTFADLDADVEEDEAWQSALLQEAAAKEALLAQGHAPLEVGTPAVEIEAAFATTPLDTQPPDLASNRINTASIPRSTSGLATSPVLADLHASGPTFASIGRGTAASSQRKNDWAGQPSTAVSAARADETALQVGDLTIADASERRGSGPIPISGGGGTRSAQVDSISATSAWSPTPGDENGTPLNSTFLSTLAEPPRTYFHRLDDVRDAVEDVDTAEEEQYSGSSRSHGLTPPNGEKNNTTTTTSVPHHTSATHT